MAVYNVSNPAYPVQVALVSTGGYPDCIAVSGNYAYVVNAGSATMTIYNVSNASNPSLVATIGTGTFPNSVFVSGNYAYVTNNQSNTMTVYNVSNPASPAQVSSMSTGSGPQCIAVSGNYAYVTNSNINNMQVFQVSCPQLNIEIQNGGVVTSIPSWLKSGNNIYNSFTGNVGIGTSSPGWRMDVTGDINYSGTLRKNGVPVVTGVSSVTASSPLSSSGGSGPNITISQSNGTTPGFLSSSDWNTFNNKVSSQWTTGTSTIYYNGGSVGIGTSAPAASALLDVTSTSKGLLPPRMTTAQINAISSPAEGLMVYNTSLHNLVVYDGSGWKGSDGQFYIGLQYGGGIVFYVDGTGKHGLIVAPSDQSTGIIWALAAYQGTSVSGTLTTIGSGSANTDKIIAQNGAGTTYAAGLARSYNGGGYTDWFLPSKDELSQIYNNRVAIGGIGGNNYWSSSESSSSNAWYQFFGTGFQTSSPKSLALNIRAVRAF
jgi:hypothetical protein